MLAPEEKHRFRLDDFEGPLDLLLFLVRKNEVSIYDIPVAAITEQYLEFLRLSHSVDLNALTEFYQLAATLLYIKSRTLLPSLLAENEDDLEDPRKNLVEQLMEYQRYKLLSERIAEREGDFEWVWERKAQVPDLPFDEKDSFWESLEVWDLLQTFSKIMKGLSPERIIDLYEEVSINEKVSLVYELLEKQGSFLFTDLITRTGSILDVVCSFLAILELVKTRRIRLEQNKLFGDIRILGREEAA